MTRAVILGILPSISVILAFKRSIVIESARPFFLFLRTRKNRTKNNKTLHSSAKVVIKTMGNKVLKAVQKQL